MPDHALEGEFHFKQTFKCLFLDVGLVSHMTSVDWTVLGRWDDRKLVHEGGLAEQFIGQHLLFRKHGLEEPFLCYWLREAKRANAEVDFVIAERRRMISVEVKAGTAGSLRSLHQFLAREVKGAGGAALRSDLNLPSISDHQHRLIDGRPVAYRMLSLLCDRTFHGFGQIAPISALRKPGGSTSCSRVPRMPSVT
jgi:uncharacterized protein